MSKTHQAAKIAFAILGIYFLVGLCRALMYSIATLMSNFSMGTFGLVALGGFLTLGCAYAVIHFLFIKRDWLASKFISSGQDVELDSPENWLSAAYRIAILIVGLFFLQSILWQLSSQVNQLIFAMQFQTDGQMQMFSGSNLKALLLRYIFTVPVAIYLLCGAPHLVRWQIKKTNEFCKQLESE